MKKFFVGTISFYQLFVSPLTKQLLGLQSQCRFSPTCSEYAKLRIKKYGIIKGVYLSVVRILKCQPFYKEKYSAIKNF